MSQPIEYNPKVTGLLLDTFKARKRQAVARGDFVQLLKQSDKLLQLHGVTTCPDDWQDLQEAFGWTNDVWQYVTSHVLKMAQGIEPEKIVPASDEKGATHKVLSYQTLVPTTSGWELKFPQQLIDVCGHLIELRKVVLGQQTTPEFDADASSVITTRTMSECTNANGESKVLSVVALQASFADISTHVRHICLKCVGKYITCCTCHTYVNAYRYVLINSWRFYQYWLVQLCYICVRTPTRKMYGGFKGNL
jgi:hypothetical protein